MRNLKLYLRLLQVNHLAIEYLILIIDTILLSKYVLLFNINPLAFALALTKLGLSLTNSILLVDKFRTVKLLVGPDSPLDPPTIRIYSSFNGRYKAPKD